MYKSFWANDGIWTRDLFLTKETLYPWATPAYGLSGLEFKVTSLARQNFNLHLENKVSSLERETGFEPATFSLEGWRSTNWATPAFFSGLSSKDYNISKKPSSQLFRWTTFVGGAGFEPAKVKTNRFTVCPRWPLEYPPALIFSNLRADRGTRTHDLLITNQLL